MRDHHGYISAESSPGKGTAFHLYFPSFTGDSKPDVDKHAVVSGGKESILFVDDEELLVEMNRERLGRLGYKVTAVTDCLEALKLFRDDPYAFDLLITDYTMPHMTGIELAREVLHIRSGLPIILCTGYGEGTVVTAAKTSGIKGFLFKPIMIEEIAPLIRKLLEKKRDPETWR